MTKVLNFFGGPGVGKSTTATGVFHELKKRDYKCEYVSEYAKDIVWEGLETLLNNQVHVFSEQFRRQWRLINKVDWIITDSPLLLSSVYYRYYMDHADHQIFSREHTLLAIKFFEKTFLEFDNINYMIERSKKYEPTGRLQTEDQAKEVDKLIWDRMYELNLPRKLLNYETAVQEVVRSIEEDNKN